MPVPSITKKALAASMKQLMAKMPFSKISVGDICEKCGMNRKSFYYHFKDKYELVNWIFYTEFISFLEPKYNLDESEFLHHICKYLHENREFYINAFDVEGQNSFTEFFSETMQSIGSEYIKNRIKDHEFCDFLCTFFPNAFRSAVIQWLKEGTKIQPQKFASFLEQAFSGITSGESKDLP